MVSKEVREGRREGGRVVGRLFCVVPVESSFATIDFTIALTSSTTLRRLGNSQ